MNRILASLISMILLLAPVFGAYAACCVALAQGDSLQLPASEQELSPCGHAMDSEAAVAGQNPGSQPLDLGLYEKCDQGLDCCGMSAASNAMLSAGTLASNISHPQRLRVPGFDSQVPDGLLRPPSMS